jgi:hypothetical protein
MIIEKPDEGRANPEGVTGIKQAANHTIQTSIFHYILRQIFLRIPGIPL